MSIHFSCIPSRNKAGGGFGDEQCWVGPWTPNEDFGCITSHAQSTAATYFAVAVKSDVVYLIMVCLVLLLQLLELNRLATLGCRHAFFPRACVEVPASPTARSTARFTRIFFAIPIPAR